MSVVEQLEAANQANEAYEAAAKELNGKKQELLSAHNLGLIEKYSDQAMNPLLELNKKHSAEFETIRDELKLRHKLNTHGGWRVFMVLIVVIGILVAVFQAEMIRIAAIGVAAVAVVVFIILLVSDTRKKRKHKRITVHLDDFYARVKVDIMALPATDYLPSADDEDESLNIYNTFEQTVLGMRSLDDTLAKECREKMASFVMMGATSLAQRDPQFNQLPAQDEKTLDNDKVKCKRLDDERKEFFEKLKLSERVGKRFGALYHLAKIGNYSSLDALLSDFEKRVLNAPKSADGVPVPKDTEGKSDLIGYIRALQAYLQFPVLD